MSQTLESIIQELQNRIGQLVSQYETQLAVLKVQSRELVQSKDVEIEELKASKTTKEK
jgi:hypothetical protein